jgi:enoyl-CoA hydratase
LINEIVSEDELLDRAIDWAHRITANAPLAVQATKESVLRCLALDLEAAYDLEQEISSKVFQSEDAKEGPKAFAEKRTPVWQGK